MKNIATQDNGIFYSFFDIISTDSSFKIIEFNNNSIGNLQVEIGTNIEEIFISLIGDNAINWGQLSSRQWVLLEALSNNQLYEAMCLPDSFVGGKGWQFLIKPVDVLLICKSKELIAKKILDHTQEMAKLGSWTLDYKTQKLEWTKQVYKSFGLSEDSYIPSMETYRTLVHPDDLIVQQQNREQFLQSRLPYKEEVRLKQPDGSYRWFLIHGFPIVIDGEVVAVEGTNFDIHEKKMYELQLKESLDVQSKLIDEIKSNELEVYSLINNTDDFMWAVNLNYELTVSNNSFKDAFKQSFNKELEIGRYILEGLPFDFTNIWLSKYNKTFKGKIWSEELDSNGYFLKISFNPILDAEGKVVGASVYSREITARKLAQQSLVEAFENESRLNEELAAREEELNQNIDYQHKLIDNITKQEAKLAAIFNSTTDIIVSVNKELEVIEYNQAYSATIAATMNINVARSGKLQNYTGLDQWKFTTECLEKVFAGEVVTVMMSYPATTTYTVYLSVLYAPIFTSDKEVIGATIIARNVTEAKEAELQVVALNKQMAEYKLMALRSVMNPHFIFNSLNSIQYFIFRNDRTQATNYLSVFSKLIRKVLESSLKNTLDLKTELQILRHYLELEILRFENKFTYQIFLQEGVDEERIAIPSLLLQPYVENAIIHGLTNNFDSGFLKIDIKKLDHNQLLVIIEDNGIGREEALKIKDQSFVPHQSYGMMLTKERLDIINQTSDVTVEITDLYDGSKAIGTRVEIRIGIAPFDILS